jgi:hypothetical protein
MKKYKTKIAEQYIPNIEEVDIYDSDGTILGSVLRGISIEDYCIVLSTFDISDRVMETEIGVSCSFNYK